MITGLLVMWSSLNGSCQETELSKVCWNWNPYGGTKGEWIAQVEHKPQPVVVETPTQSTAEPSYDDSIWGQVVYWFGANAGYVYNRIMYCETGGTYNRYSVGRSGERGLMQIHPIHIKLINSLGYTWDDMFGIGPNLHVAYELSNHGRNFRPWSCA